MEPGPTEHQADGLTMAPLAPLLAPWLITNAKYQGYKEWGVGGGVRETYNCSRRELMTNF